MPLGDPVQVLRDTKMTRPIRRKITIQRDGTLELHDPALREGDEVIVHVESVGGDSAPDVPAHPAVVLPTMASIIGSGASVFDSADEANAFIRNLRDEWDD